MQKRAVKILVAGAILAGIVAAVASLLRPEKPVSWDTTDGVYVSADCGEFSLQKGTLRFGREQMPYILGSDDRVPYALPDHFVGIALAAKGKCRMITTRSLTPLKLSFETSNHAPGVTLFDLTGGNSRNFYRRGS